MKLTKSKLKEVILENLTDEELLELARPASLWGGKEWAQKAKELEDEEGTGAKKSDLKPTKDPDTKSSWGPEDSKALWAAHKALWAKRKDSDI